MIQPRRQPRPLPPANRTVAPFAALVAIAAFAAFAAFAIMISAFSGCVTERRIYDSEGVLIRKETIVKRPVKDFVDKVEFE